MSNEKPATREPDEDTANVEPPSSEGTSRGRAIAAVICLVLAGLLTTPAAVAYWGQRTLNDADRYVDTVGPLVDSEEVQDVIATKVTEAIQQQVDIEKILNDVFAGDHHMNGLGSSCSVGPLSAAVNGSLPACVRPDQQEVGDVGARHQQDDAYRPHQHPEHPAHVSDDVLLEGPQRGAISRVAKRRIPFRPLGGRRPDRDHATDIGIGLRHCHAGLQPGNAQVPPDRHRTGAVDPERQDDVGRRRSHRGVDHRAAEAELRGHHADDLVGT